MQDNTGFILPPEEFRRIMAGDNDNAKRHLVEMKLPPTPKQLRRNPARVGRNEPCPCGSGKKFKNCHLAH